MAMAAKDPVTTYRHKSTMCSVGDETIVSNTRRSSGEESYWYTSDIPSRQARALPTQLGEDEVHVKMTTPSETIGHIDGSNRPHTGVVRSRQARALSPVDEEESVNSDTYANEDELLQKMRSHLMLLPDDEAIEKIARIPGPVYEKLFPPVKDLDDDFWDKDEVVGTGAYWSQEEIALVENIALPDLPPVPEKTALDIEVEQLAAESTGPLVPFSESMSQREFFRYVRAGYDMSNIVKGHLNKSEFLKIWHHYVEGKRRRYKTKSARYSEPSDSRIVARESVGDTCLLPDYGTSRVPKPLEYIHVTFMRWLRGEASFLHKRKALSEVVMPNTSAFILMGNASGASSGALTEMLQAAAIQTVARESAFPADSCLSVSARTLDLGSFLVRNIAELSLFEAAFEKHRPLYKWCAVFLDGGAGDFTTLSDQVLRHITPYVIKHEHVFTDRIAAFEAAKRTRQETLYNFTHTPEPVTRQGNVPSLGSSVVSEVATSGAGESLGFAVSRGALAHLSTVFTADVMLEIVRRCTAWGSAVALVCTFTTPTQYVLFAGTMVTQSDVVWEYVSGVKRQGADEGDAFKAMAMTLYAQVAEFFGSVSKALIPSFLEMCGAVKFACLKDLGAAAAQKIVQITLEFAHRVKSCIENRSLQPLFGYDFSRWIRHSRGLISWRSMILEAKKSDEAIFRDMRRNDDLPEAFLQHMTHAQFTEALELHLTYASQFRGVVPAAHLPAFDGMVNRVKELRVAHVQEQRGIVDRLVPFCVSIYGPAGTAKTTFANTMAEHAASLEGRDASSIYQYVSNLNFHTNFRGHSTVVRMDDPDKSLAAVSAGFEDHCGFIQRLVSSQPFPVEQADVESKGKIYAAPLDVIISTNHEHMFAHAYSSDPSAIWRRPKMYIKAKLNPKYAVDGVLDDTKVQPLEAISYDIGKFVKTNNPIAFTLRPIHENLRADQLMRIWFEMRNEHFESQNARRNMPKCLCCRLPIGMCYCDTFVGTIPLATPEPIVLERCDGCFAPIADCECPAPPGKVPCAKCAMWDATCETCSGPERQGNVASAAVDKLMAFSVNSRGLGLLACVSVPAVAMLIKGLEYYQGREAGLAHDSWFRADPIAQPALPPNNPVTWVRADVVKRVAEMTFLLRGEGGTELHAVIIRPGYILFPTHVFGPKKTASGVFRGMPVKVRGDSSLVSTYLNAELSVAYCAELTSQNGVWPYIAKYDSNARTFADASLLGLTETPLGIASAGMMHGLPCISYAGVTVDGDCGQVLGAEGPGGGFRLLAMHVFFQSGLTPRSSGVPINQNALEACMHRMGVQERAVLQGSFLGHNPPTLSKYPPKSEIGVAMTYHNARAICLGTRPDAIGQTMKTGNVPTSYQHKVIEFADSRGIFRDYAVPEFRGGMVDGVYVSPYTAALADGNVATYDFGPAIEILAERIQGHYGGPLSEEQAIRGTPGEFNSINMKTSCGPPFNCPKTKHFDKLAAELSPDMVACIDEIEGLLDSGVAPLAYFKAVLKDEVLKTGKPARVFTVTSAAYNVVLKKYTAPLKRAMRASFTQSGCAVGLDCGSRKIEDIIEYLQGYDYLYDADARKMDKSWTPELWDAVIELAVRITTFSAGFAVGQKLRLLLMGLKDAIIEIKGDLMVLFWNPSGNDITVELNSLAMMIILQTVALMLAIALAWVTYGDDTILGSRVPLPLEFTELFTRISGIELTDGAKQAHLRALPLTALTFLKRMFRHEQENGCWMAPLQESSIVKMLMYREKGTLTTSDHEIALLDAALRYALLHGRQVYGEWEAFVRGLPLAEWVKFPNFDQFLEDYKGGQFTDWTDRQALHEGVRRQSKQVDFNMSDISMTPPANEQMPATVAPTTAEERVSATTGTDAHRDATLASLSGSVKASLNPQRFVTFQEPVQYDLNDFLSRWTRLRTLTLFSGDTPLGYPASAAILSFNPVNEFFTNARVAEKIKNFSYWKADIELMFVTAVPGSASGAYVISAIPQVTGASYGSMGDEQCMNVDNFVYFGMEASTTVTMQLPFWSTLDMNPVTNPLTNGYWSITVTCLSPLRTAIAGGVSTGSVTVYARFMEGYKLLVPRWQGRTMYQGRAMYQSKRVHAMISKAQEMQKTKVLSSTSSKIAGAAHMLSDVPIIGGVASAIAGVADTATSILSYFGFSRTVQQPVLQNFANRSVSNVALSTGVDSADVAGFDPGNCISVDTTITGAGDTDPMAFEAVSGRWTAIANAAWSPAVTQDTILLTVPICPGFGYGDLNFQRPTGAGAVGLPFEYWRADAEIRVIVPASILHRGTLQAIYVPTTSAPLGTDDTTTVTLNAVMDVSSATMFDYTIGFANNNPMLPLRYWNTGFTIQPIGAANGVVQIKVINPLVSQNPSDTINIVVLVRFKNVQFAVPRTTFQWPNSGNTGLIDTPWEDAITFQGKAVGDDGEETEPLVAELVATTGTYAIKDVVAGEEVGSLRALAQRPSRLVVPATGPFCIGFGGMYGTAGFTQRLTTAGVAGSFFVTMAASENVKIFPKTTAWVGASALTTASMIVPTTFQNFFPAHMPMTFAGSNMGGEFMLPYYYPQRSRISRITGTLATSGGAADLAMQQHGRFALIQQVGTTDSRVYYSFGSDIRPGPYRFPVIWGMSRGVTIRPWFAYP